MRKLIRQLLGRTYSKATSLDVLLDMQPRQPENRRRNLCPGATPAQIVSALEGPHASQGTTPAAGLPARDVGGTSCCWRDRPRPAFSPERQPETLPAR